MEKSPSSNIPVVQIYIPGSLQVPREVSGLLYSLSPYYSPPSHPSPVLWGHHSRFLKSRPSLPFPPYLRTPDSSLVLFGEGRNPFSRSSLGTATSSAFVFPQSGTSPLPASGGNTQDTFTFTLPQEALLALTVEQACFPFSDKKIKLSRYTKKNIKWYHHFGLLTFKNMSLKGKYKHMN